MKSICMSRRIGELLVEGRFEGVWEEGPGGPWGGKVTQVSVSGVSPSVNLTEAHGKRGCSQ